MPEPVSGIDFVGPFEAHAVLVNERVVPNLQAFPKDGGRVLLTLDRRLGLELSVAEAERFVPFLAHSIAVAMGYASFPGRDDEPVPSPPFPRLSSLIAAVPPEGGVDA